jgi:hypothetical protein
VLAEETAAARKDCKYFLWFYRRLNDMPSWNLARFPDMAPRRRNDFCRLVSSRNIERNPLPPDLAVQGDAARDGSALPATPNGERMALGKGDHPGSTGRWGSDAEVF